MKRTFAALAVVLALGATAEASKVKLWHQHTTGHFDKAKFDQAVVRSDGVIRLSRQLKPLANVDAANVWAVAEDKQGTLYAATGDPGKVLRIDAAGAHDLYAAKDPQVLSLVAADDALYAGTGPAGRVIRIARDGTATVVAEGLGSYVWSLAYDPATQTLFAGTGPKGKIYRIDPKGKASVFYDTKQEHILALAVGSRGALYAGTDKGGLVYRIDASGKGYVLFHAHQNEVRSLVVTPGALYAGTSSPLARKGSGSSGGKSSSSSDDSRPSGTPATGENSVYRIAPNGTVRELLRDKTLMLSLLRQNGHLLVGTGMNGQLFDVDEATKEHVEIARLDHGQVHGLLRRRDGSIVVAAGDPGKLYALQDKFAVKGTVLSDVLDAKMMSRWGAMTWHANTPAGTAVTIAVRAGNVAEPDDTWSAWSAEQTDPRQAKAAAPTARYLQYRVTLTTEDARTTPEFRNFNLRYQSVNQAPEITGLDVPDLDSANLDNPKKLKVKWSATDPNDDGLSYSIYLRKEGWQDWVRIEENLEKKEFEWDTTGVPSGLYRFKVVASDRRDNAPADALTAARVSPPVPVSHEPPAVTLKLLSTDGERATFEATAADPYVRLTEAAFAIDGKRWVHVFPTDGLFDSKTESFRFTTDALRPGTHVVLLRVRNAGGGFGNADVVLTVPVARASN
jgi:hypothetical protein